jgi:hypothetical protein
MHTVQSVRNGEGRKEREREEGRKETQEGREAQRKEVMEEERFHLL